MTRVRIFTNFLRKTRIRSAYSSELALVDFFSSPKPESTLKSRRLESIDAIKENLLAMLCNIHEEEFQECFKTRKKRWRRCIPNEAEYSEGDKAE